MPTNLIPLAEGAEMTKAFKEKKEDILADPYKNKGTLPTCETFNRQAFDTLLALPDCRGLRIYSALDEREKLRFIIVGVNNNNEDIYIPGNDDHEVFVIEAGLRCPDTCPEISALNR